MSVDQSIMNEFAAVKAEMSEWFPKVNAPPLLEPSAMKTGRDALIYLIGSGQPVK